MRVTADPLQGRDNMIKRLNKYVLKAIFGIRFRSVAAVFLGASAGLSLTSTVLPTVIELAGASDSFSARLELSGLAVYAIMLWGVGGWAARKAGGVLGGAIVLGLVGLISAAVFSAMALGTGAQLLLLCAAAGMAYGTFGGMLIAAAPGEPNVAVSRTE